MGNPISVFFFNVSSMARSKFWIDRRRSVLVFRYHHSCDCCEVGHVRRDPCCCCVVVARNTIPRDHRLECHVRPPIGTPGPEFRSPRVPSDNRPAGMVMIMAVRSVWTMTTMAVVVVSAAVGTVDRVWVVTIQSPCRYRQSPLVRTIQWRRTRRLVPFHHHHPRPWWWWIYLLVYNNSQREMYVDCKALD